MEWSNAKVFEFLELYQGEPIIWNPKHPLHKNVKKVNDSWKKISSSLNTSINELKAKKNSLMATFRSHRRRKEASIKAGAEHEDIYCPIWFAYEKMEEFLAPVYDCRSTPNTVDADEEILPLEREEQQQNEIEKPPITNNETQESIETDEETQLNRSGKSNENAVPVAKQEKRRRIESEIKDARTQITQTYATLNSLLTKKCEEKKEVDDCDLYGQLLAKKLRNYPMHQRYLLMHDIDGLLLQNPPPNAIIPPISSHSSSSAPSSIINLHPPVSTTLNEHSYTTLSEQQQSPLLVVASSHNETVKVEMSVPLSFTD